jgi:hypothetical protein
MRRLAARNGLRVCAWHARRERLLAEMEAVIAWEDKALI